MKKYSKISIICLLSLFTLSILTPMVLSTTIGDTTFPAEVGKRYVWDFTYPSAARGYKYGFRADSITQGLHMTHESLIVYATISGYSPSTKLWQDFVDNDLYLAANETQDYLYFNDYEFHAPFVIPTPINLSLVATTIAAWPEILSYSIDDNTITFNSTDGYTSYEFTFNSKGFITVGIEKDEGELYSKFVLAGGGGEIPFGIYFLIPTVSSIAVIVIFVKKRQLRIR